MFITDKQHVLPGAPLKIGYESSKVTLLIRKNKFYETNPGSEKEQLFINWLCKSGEKNAVMIVEVNIFKINPCFTCWKSFLFLTSTFSCFKMLTLSNGKSSFPNHCNNTSNIPNLFSHRLFPTDFFFSLFYMLRIFMPLTEELLQNHPFIEEERLKTPQ